MSTVLSRVAGEFFVAHLEPHQGVGYDCLSLVSREPNGTLTVRFMLNRNGENAKALDTIVDRVWDRASSNGLESVAAELISASRLQPATDRVTSHVSAIVDEVVEWIGQHTDSDFCVGPPGRPSSCRTLLRPSMKDAPSELWPIKDHGPELVLGIDGAEQMRLSFVPPADVLALDIARCAEIRRAVADQQHPCHRIVHSQEPVEDKFRQVPEAWAGNLSTARIIVISSNPSISTPEFPGTGEDYPLAGYDDAGEPHPSWPTHGRRLVDFQTQRFDQHRAKPLVTPQAQFLCSDGQYRGNDKPHSFSAHQKYWKAAFDQAKSLIGPDFDMGRDLCLTEIVHCKSKREMGVTQAAPHCADRYFMRMLEVATAPVAIIGGSKARSVLFNVLESESTADRQRWDIPDAFGQLKSTHVRSSDHVGLFRSGTRRCILIACQQLSYSSNTRRFVHQVLGTKAATRLSVLLRADEPPEFESRRDVLGFLGLE